MLGYNIKDFMYMDNRYNKGKRVDLLACVLPLAVIGILAWMMFFK